MCCITTYKDADTIIMLDERYVNLWRMVMETNILASIRGDMESERQYCLKYRLMAETMKDKGYSSFSQMFNDMAASHEHNMRRLDYIHECLINQ